VSTAATVERILERIGHRQPKLAIVLSTGLQAVDGDIEDPTTFTYAELPGFPKSTVASHRGRLLLGKLAGHSVALLESHEDYYLSGRIDAMREPLEVAVGLGCGRVLLTAAAHSLRTDLGPGRLALVTSHAMLGDPNQLSHGFGTRYPIDWHAAYDPVLTERLIAAAARVEVPLGSGCFGWAADAGQAGAARNPNSGVQGPGVRGADMIGRSLIPEGIIARALGMRSVAVANIIDWAPGAAPAGVSPDLAKQRADFGAIHLRRILADHLQHGGAD
jgi:purine nucleoside phosphorylase